MKVLFVSTVKSHIGQFHMPFIRQLKSLGCTVDAAFKDNSSEKKGLDLSEIDNVFEVPFSRSPYSFDNVKAYKELKKIIDNGNYDAVHCHTPMGAVVTRLAAKSARRNGTKVIYTAHGFHFYNGASKKNWLLFYPVEKYLSKYTDCLITINEEDYKTATEKGFSAGMITKVNGVGVDTSKFVPVSGEEKSRLRKEYGYSDDDFIMIYPADFSFRKNQPMLFEALKIIVKNHSNIKALLPGLTVGAEADDYLKQIKDNNLENNALVLGYRRDIEKLVALSDISVSTSRQEGLPINLVEAMAAGNPIVATDVRGNNDLVDDGENGFLVKLNDSSALAEKLDFLIENRNELNRMGQNSIKKVEKYSIPQINERLIEIYKELSLL